MSADAESFCERQNRQPIQIGFVSDIRMSADVERFFGFQNNQLIQIGFVNDISRLMLRGLVSDKTIS